jgi:hypothetical protein
MTQYTRGVGPLTTKGTIKHTTENGTETWRLNGELHRVNGPARIWSDGVADWYRDGVLHRIDGPARDWDGDNWWYVRGNPIFTYEELQEVTELSEADVLLLKLKWGPMGPWPDHAENGEE